MAILQRTAFYPQQRLDIPDARAIEAYCQNDWRYFLSGILSQTDQIITGFDITNYQALFAAGIGPKLQCSNLALIHPTATTQAAGFYVSSGTEPDTAVVLNPSATNYVEMDFGVQNGGIDVRAFWDQGANGGAGGEYTDNVATVINLTVQIYVNISGFTAGRVPLYKFVTNGSNAITSITDCRPMFLRLGSGGASPDPTNEYAFRNLPDVTHARFETPVTATAANTVNAPWQGGDKNLRSVKEWMDLAMTQIKQGLGLPYWYMAAPVNLPRAYQNAAMTVLMGGTFVHGITQTVTAVSSSTITIGTAGSGTLFAASGTILVNGTSWTYTSYSSGVFSGLTGPSGSTNPTTSSPVVSVGNTVTQGLNGHLSLSGASSIYRLGLNNATLTSFNNVDLSSNPLFYVFLTHDGSAVGYGFGQDAATPITPKAATGVSTGQITVASGGNYVTGGGKLYIRNQSFSYMGYAEASGTGTFSGITPDPAGLAQVGDYVYQANNSSTGYYHRSTSAAAPSTVGSTGLVSSGAERTFWLATYDGSTSMIMRNSLLLSGASATVGSSGVTQICQFIGSSGQTDNFPVYNVSTVANGTSLTTALSKAFQVMEKPIYDEIITDPGSGWLNGATLTIPVNSRASNAQAYYTVGRGELCFYENGMLLRPGYDYNEVGSSGALSNTVTILRDISSGSYLRFRIANIGGSVASGGVSGSSGTLQTDYGNGNVIAVTSGTPVTLTGTAGQTLLRVQGNAQTDTLQIQGGAQFIEQASTPIASGQSGFWVDTSHKLQYTKNDGTTVAVGSAILDIFGSQNQYFSRNKTNSTGATIPAFSVVYLKSDGTINLATATSATKATIYGVTLASIANTASGPVAYGGVVAGALTGLGFTTGTYLYLSSTAGVMSTTLPTAAGSLLRMVGVVDGNDLILRLVPTYTSLTEELGGQLEAPSNKTYTLDLAASYGYSLTNLTIKTSSGTCTVAVQINGVNVTGLGAVSVTSTVQTVSATANNTLNAGDMLTLVVSSNSSATDLVYSIKGLRT